MAEMKSLDSLPTFTEVKDGNAKKSRSARQAKRELKKIRGKKFSELDSAEKDILLHAVALRLGFVKPE